MKTGANIKHPNKAASPEKGETDKTRSRPGFSLEKYFRRLRRRLQLGLLGAFIIPLLLLSAYFHFQFTTTLKESGKLHLRLLAESQRNTVDLFLQERVVNILNLFHGQKLQEKPSPDHMRLYLQHLREMSDAFIDVSFLNSNGIQVGYAGPYPHLRGKDYSKEQWFKKLMNQTESYYITDIYMGFRRKPHFTIAIKQVLWGRTYIMRATLDPDKFYMFLKNIGEGKGTESYLLNRQGEYQIVEPKKGELLDASAYIPPRNTGSGAYEISVKGSRELAAYSWLKMTPWVLVIRQPMKMAYANMYRVQKIMIIATVIIILVLISITWLITDKLLRKTQESEESRTELRHQLIQTAKLVSMGELASGVAHEINNPLAIISSESGVIRDMQNPKYGMDNSPEAVKTELDHIDEAVARARGITQKLLEFVRQSEPKLIETDVSRVLNDVVGGLIEKELKVSNINLVRDLDPDLPKIVCDPNQLSQVFLNLINNAKDAIEGSGTITISTCCKDGFIRATVADTGKGMNFEQTQKIFRPFYTTKEEGKGTGLGLSISLSIVESMGGTIEVQSVPGAGSAFCVVLPTEKMKEFKNVG